jgi:UDP-N-acetylmuramate: L-alanyl-gamma-D-glutamyl-meso-diaminopimelate ligase
MIAICGTGMTALAGMLKSAGYTVRGSDNNVYPPMSDFLDELGVEVFSGFHPANIEPSPDFVVIGNSISRGNPEVEAVLNGKLPYFSMPFVLRELFIRGHQSCVVAGTHGKTSTSSLLAWVLENAGRDPSFFVGGIPENFGRGYKLGQGEIFITEGDEYDSAFFDKSSKFLHYLPDMVILNNIEFDHADIFRDFDDVKLAFQRLVNIIPGNGFLFSCWDDPVVVELSGKAFAKVISFGLDKDAEWRAENVTVDRKQTTFDVCYKHESIGTFNAPLFGKHNLRNCLAVIAACKEFGLKIDEIRDGISSFKNVRRRLQFTGQRNGVLIFDDFAHHPTAILLTIEGLQQRFPGKRLWAIFEPRTSTSKRKLFTHEFAKALSLADRVVLTPLFMPEKVPAEERLSVKELCEKLHDLNTRNWIYPADEKMIGFLKEHLSSDDIVLFMSNGNLNQIPKKLLEEL